MIKNVKIYITHCSAKKHRLTQAVHPDRLYCSKRIRAFMSKCKEQKVKWAIVSDKYGVWFPQVIHKWYEKPPGTVTKQEFHALVRSFNKSLAPYRQIRFYYHPARFHSLYRCLLRRTKLRHKIVQFTKVRDIL